MPESALSKAKTVGCMIDIPGLNVVYSLSLYYILETPRIIASIGSVQLEPKTWFQTKDGDNIMQSHQRNIYKVSSESAYIPQRVFQNSVISTHYQVTWRASRLLPWCRTKNVNISWFIVQLQQNNSYNRYNYFDIDNKIEYNSIHYGGL